MSPRLGSRLCPMWLGLLTVVYLFKCELNHGYATPISIRLWIICRARKTAEHTMDRVACSLNSLTINGFGLSMESEHRPGRLLPTYLSTYYKDSVSDKGSSIGQSFTCSPAVVVVALNILFVVWRTVYQ